MKYFLGFWLVFAIAGVATILNTGATFSSVTCATGEIVGDIKQCPQCVKNSDCQSDNLDRVCNTQTAKCETRSCMGVNDCADPRSQCEFNKCIFQDELEQLAAKSLALE